MTTTTTENTANGITGLAVGLPRVVRGGDDAVTARSMRLLAGYIKVLGPQVKVVVNSPAHLAKLATALVLVLELDTSDIRLIAERCVIAPLAIAPCVTAPLAIAPRATAPRATTPRATAL
jgi:hypothetical protein